MKKEKENRFKLNQLFLMLFQNHFIFKNKLFLNYFYFFIFFIIQSNNLLVQNLKTIFENGFFNNTKNIILVFLNFLFIP